MKTTIAAAALLLLAAAAFASPPCNSPALPKPNIGYNGATNGAPGYSDQWFVVLNASQYDNTLFAASPTLPACGLNKSASRTWLDVYSDTGVRLYGYCALANNTQIMKLAFPVKDGAKPKGFFIRLHDRKCARTVQSNTVYNW